MATDSTIRDHQAWLGYLQPDGLVVSPAALVDSQVLLDKNAIGLQQSFISHVVRSEGSEHQTRDALVDIPSFFSDFMQWPDECFRRFADDDSIPECLTSPLPEYGETLAPSFAFRDPRLKEPADGYVILGKTLKDSESLDEVRTGKDRTWGVSETRKFERLLRETGIPIGIITNHGDIRLMYAPRGENTGTLTFPVQAMTEVAGRPILSALHMLLSGYRLLSAPTEARLPALLKKSRDYQSNVSTELARQVLDALYELVRGFQSANDHSHGELLAKVLRENPNDVYAGLLTVLMRMVFLLYAEDRGLMPTSSLYCANYSAHGLFEKLRADHERFPDTMDHRYGAWARLLALFRAVYQGCEHQEMKMPARKGYLFDPQRYPFLEGQTLAGQGLPLVSDGIVFRILNNLLMLDGERLSYRTLDVEQIGSVYETMMGFRLEVTTAQSIALKPAKSKGAPVVIDLEACLAQKPADRAKWFVDTTEQKLSDSVANGVKSATGIDELLVALERRIARNATPQPVPAGTMVLQPSDERRRSGSHYTPRSLTEPIVRTTIRPILERLGAKPTPAQILELKIADIAVGSGAFLVETCRQLGDELVKAWHNHGEKPAIPPDEDEVLFARRRVAQRCLYGVDRNPMAADLAKLSLWLATLAKDHPFTFLDHSIRCGDSLVGLTKVQIAEFHWEPGQNRVWGQDEIEQRVEHATKYRRELLEADEDFVSPELKAQKLKLADEALNFVRQVGDCVIAAFFAGKNNKERQQKRDMLVGQVTEFYKSWSPELNPEKVVKELKSGKFPVLPFHWEIEFPEVFGRENPGFDGIVGNPPFVGGKKISTSNSIPYLHYIQDCTADAGGQADLVAYFFRKAYSNTRTAGTLGLIATNTISQGDTRYAGLRWICVNGGLIYDATRNYRWPGEAAVVVSVVHLIRGPYSISKRINGCPVKEITAYLFEAGGNENPHKLLQNVAHISKGVEAGCPSFIFDDGDSSALPTDVMHSLIGRDPEYRRVILPFIGGDEILNKPSLLHNRYIANLHGLAENEAFRWKELMSLLREKVMVHRQGTADERIAYWNFRRPGILSHTYSQPRYLARPFTSDCHAFAYLPKTTVLSTPHSAILLPQYSAFPVLQSRPHEIWARFFGSSLKMDLRYTPSDCFETFPFPRDYEANGNLESIGKEYYEFRAALMIKNNEGLTKTYNRFHDRDHDGTGIEGRTPSEVIADINRLRELHAKMDRAVLDAYGWTDIPTDCEFILEYEDDSDDGEETGKKRKKKKPWRYRWPDDIHDEVLARLLKLNAERAEEERLTGLTEKKQGAKSKKKKVVREEATSEDQTNLFG